MSAQHTAGPWEADDVRILRAVRAEDGEAAYTKRLVALVYSNTEGGLAGNANLIAAAPELLDALVNVPLPSTIGTAEEHYRRFYAWLEGPARAAIAKATGAA